MKKDRQHIIDLLRRWLNGEAKASDERELQQSASNDPFLRDALDGLQAFPEAEHEKTAARLRQSLQKRTGKRSRIGSYRWPQIAAAAIGIIAIGASLWFLNQPGSELMNQISLGEEATKEVNDPFETNLDEVMATEEPVLEEVLPAEKKSIADGESGPREASPALPRTQQPASSPKPIRAPTPSKAKKADPPPPPFDDEVARAEEEEENPRVAAYGIASDVAKGFQADTLSQVISGRVTSQGGSPVSGAEVIVPGTAMETITDTNGTFTIATPLTQKNLLVNPGDLAPNIVPIENKKALDITLPEQLDEMDKQARRIAPQATEPAANLSYPDPFSAVATPENGFEDFETYLKDNMRYPRKARRNRIEGIVLLQFQVALNGKLSDFSVLRSLDKDLDKEAIRLLREGPKWLLFNSSQAAYIKYPIVFKLED